MNRYFTSQMSNVKYVDMKKTFDSLNFDNLISLLEFNKYLKRKGYWRLDKQISLIKEITRRVRDAIVNDDLNEFVFLMSALEVHWRDKMFDEDKLVEAKYNPLTHFLMNCHETKIQEYPLSGKYVDFLLDIGDDRINRQVFHDIEYICHSRYVNIGFDTVRN